MNEILEVVRGNAGQVFERRRQPAQLLPPMPFSTVDSLTRFDADVQQNEQMRSEFVSIQKLTAFSAFYNSVFLISLFVHVG